MKNIGYVVDGKKYYDLGDLHRLERKMRDRRFGAKRKEELGKEYSDCFHYLCSVFGRDIIMHYAMAIDTELDKNF